MDVRRMRSWGAKLGAFMDDVKLYHKGERTMQTAQLQELASRDIQLWAILLWVVGEKINL